MNVKYLEIVSFPLSSRVATSLTIFLIALLVVLPVVLVLLIVAGTPASFVLYPYLGLSASSFFPSRIVAWQHA